jgi:hypothetical protein
LFFFIRKRHHRLGIEADVIRLQPIVLGVLHVMVDLGRAQQGLGGNAAPVEADAAEIRALDDRGLEAELRRADGGDVTAGAGADDQDVEAGVGHEMLSIRIQTVTASLTPASRSGSRYIA